MRHFLLKKYITKIQDIYLKQKHLYNDYERFFIRNVIESSDFTEYKKKIGSDAALTYKTRYKIQREKNIKISLYFAFWELELEMLNTYYKVKKYFMPLNFKEIQLKNLTHILLIILKITIFNFLFIG